MDTLDQSGPGRRVKGNVQGRLMDAVEEDMDMVDGQMTHTGDH